MEVGPVGLLSLLPPHLDPQTNVRAPGTAETSSEIWTGGEFIWDRLTVFVRLPNRSMPQI